MGFDWNSFVGIVALFPNRGKFRQVKPHVLRIAASVGVFLTTLGVATPSHAQSIREAVKEYVEEGLEKEGKPKGQRAGKNVAKARRRASSSPPRTSGVRRSSTTAGEPEEGFRISLGGDSKKGGDIKQAPETGPSLPQRVFGKQLRVDFKLGGGFRGWYPAQFPQVSIDHAGYFTWSADVKAKFFNFLRLHRGYYESTGLAGPRTNEAAIAAQVGKVIPRAAWLLGALGVPLSKSWETLIRYEARTFATRARPSRPVAIASRDTDPDTNLAELPRVDSPLRFESGFETLLLGIRYYPERMDGGLAGEKGAKILPQYLGVGFTQYSKPYQVSLGNGALDDVLFDGRFRGVGLAYGLTSRRGIEVVYGDLDVQAGLGEVTLLDDLTLNELLPDDWLIGYVQGSGKLGYTWPVFRGKPSLLLTTEGSLGGASFFYLKTQSEKQDGDGEPDTASAPSLNWDLLWSVQVRLTLPL